MMMIVVVTMIVTVILRVGYVSGGGDHQYVG